MDIIIIIIMIVIIMLICIIISTLNSQELIGKLEMADTRSENAEMDIGRLNVRIDKVMVIIIMMMLMMMMTLRGIGGKVGIWLGRNLFCNNQPKLPTMGNTSQMVNLSS